jgi:copper chaperone CopZ
VRRAAERVDGVTEARVSHQDGRAVITYDRLRTDPEAIATAITEDSGFKAAVWSEQEGTQR